MPKPKAATAAQPMLRYALRCLTTGRYVDMSSYVTGRYVDHPVTVVGLGTIRDHRARACVTPSLHGPFEIVQIQVLETVLGAVAEEEAVTARLHGLGRALRNDALVRRLDHWKDLRSLMMTFAHTLHKTPEASTMRYLVQIKEPPAMEDEQLAELIQMIWLPDGYLLKSPGDLTVFSLLEGVKLGFVYDFEAASLL